MKKLHYTKHLSNRLKLRKIPKSIIKKLLKNPDSIFYDVLNKTKIALGKEKEVCYMIAFLELTDIINVITIHPIKKLQIKNRLKNKRWVKID